MIANMPQRVAALVNQVGQTITYKRVTGQSFNTSTGINTPTYETVSVKASIRDYQPRDIMQNVRVGDRRATIAGHSLGFTPAKDDVVLVNGKEFAVIAVEQRNVTDDAALFVLQIRGA